MTIILRELTPADEQAFISGLKDWVGESPHWYSFVWNDSITFTEMLSILARERARVNLAPGRVPHTMLYGFLNGEIVGRVSIRHTLNENLRKRGGHIGYAVAPRFRKQGFATELTRQALGHCKELGIKDLMVTCSDNNIPSWKIIEHFHGRLEDKVWDEEDKEMIRRYWITLGEE